MEKSRKISIRLEVDDNGTTKLTRFADQSQKSFNLASRHSKTFDNSLVQLNSSLGGLVAGLGPIPALVTGAFGVGAVADFVRSTSEAYQNSQALNRAFEASAGDAKSAAKEMEWLRATSDKLGQNFWQLAEAYKGIHAASQKTTLEGQGVRDIFESITMAGTALGLSGDQVKGTLRAIEQMMSKGKIQAEELRGQLGERLPGAFRIFAAAMGVSTAKLDDMLKKGEVLAEDVLPKVDKLLREMYGEKAAEAAQSTRAQTSKLSEAFTDLSTTIGEKLDPAMSNFTMQLTELVKAINRGAKSMAQTRSEMERTPPGLYAGEDYVSTGGEYTGQDTTVRHGSIEVPHNFEQVLQNTLADIQRRAGNLALPDPDTLADKPAIVAHAYLSRGRIAEQLASDELRYLYMLADYQKGQSLAAGVSTDNWMLRQQRFDEGDAPILAFQAEQRRAQAAAAKAAKEAAIQNKKDLAELNKAYKEYQEGGYNDAWRLGGYGADDKPFGKLLDAHEKAARQQVQYDEEAAAERSAIQGKYTDRMVELTGSAEDKRRYELKKTSDFWREQMENGLISQDDYLRIMEAEEAKSLDSRGKKYEAFFAQIENGLINLTSNALDGIYDQLQSGEADWTSYFENVLNSAADFMRSIGRLQIENFLRSQLSGQTALIGTVGASGNYSTIIGPGGQGAGGLGGTLGQLYNLGSTGYNLLGGGGGMGSWLVNTLGSPTMIGGVMANPGMAGMMTPGMTGGMMTNTLFGYGAGAWSGAFTGMGIGSLAGGILAPLIFGTDGYASQGGSIGGGLGAGIGTLVGGPVGGIIGGLLGTFAGGGLGSLFGDDSEQEALEAFERFKENLEAFSAGDYDDYAALVEDFHLSDNRASQVISGEALTAMARAQGIWYAEDPYEVQGLNAAGMRAHYLGLPPHLLKQLPHSTEALDPFAEAIDTVADSLGPFASMLEDAMAGMDLAELSAEDLAAALEDRLNPATHIQEQLTRNLADGMFSLDAATLARNDAIEALLGSTGLSVERENELIDLLMRESGSVADLTAKYNRYQEIQGLLASAHEMSREEIQALVDEGRTLRGELGLEQADFSDLGATLRDDLVPAIMDLVAALNEIPDEVDTTINHTTHYRSIYHDSDNGPGNMHTGGAVGLAQVAMDTGLISLNTIHAHAGLAFDEVPIIAQVDEVMWSRGQVANWGGVENVDQIRKMSPAEAFAAMGFGRQSRAKQDIHINVITSEGRTIKRMIYRDMERGGGPRPKRLEVRI